MKKNRILHKAVGKKVLAAALCAVMTVSLAACQKGAKQPADSGNAGVEYVYVPEYITLGDDPNANYGSTTFMGDNLYYTRYSWDEETQTSGTALGIYSLKDQTAKEIPLPEDANVDQYCPDAEGNIYVMGSVYPDEADADGNWNPSFYVTKYDASGNEVFKQDMTDAFKEASQDSWPQGMTLDGEGNIYVNFSESICLFDATGAPKGSISLNNSYIGSNCMVQGSDGKVYAAYNDYSTGNGDCVLAEMNFQSREIEKTYANVPGSYVSNLVAANEKHFLLNDGSSVYDYDAAAESGEKLFQWIDCDINGNNVNGFGMSEDGTVYAVIYNWGENGSNTELVKLTKTKASEVKQKEQVVIGTLWNDSELQAAAVAFNKKSDTYHVTIKTYVDENSSSENSYEDALTRLNNDITSGANCPDILSLSQLNQEQMQAKGVFEDLMPYLEKSSVLSKDSFVDGILEQFTTDGKLIAIPKTFNLTTLVGKTSIVGDTMGWSLTDMINCAKEHPDSQLFGAMTKESAMYYCMMFNQDHFIDWENGKCNFDNEEFKTLLEFVKQFPKAEDIDWDAYYSGSQVEQFQSEAVLLDDVYISEVNDVQMYPAMFDADVTYIGFPTMDGSVGCSMNSSTRYGITSKSQHKDGAWAFIENYLTDDSNDMYSWGFSTMKDPFEKTLAEATKEDYVLDENGEPMLDEEGNPIIGGTSSMSMNGWEYTFHTATEEEVKQVRELVAAAHPAAATSDEVLSIIQEEAEPFFQDQKSLDEVVNIIQSRLNIYVSENS